MRSFGMAAAVAVMFIGCTAGAQSGPGGEWTGTLRLPAETLYVRLSLADDASAGSVAAALPRPLTVVFARGTARGVDLRLAGRADTLDLSGARTADTLRGSIIGRGTVGDFVFLRIAPVNPALYDEYVGGYDLAPGRAVFIRRQDRLSERPPFGVERSWLQFVDEAGRTRVLYPDSQSEFFAGPAYAIPVPVTVRVKFVRDVAGRVVGLRWSEGVQPESYAPRTNRYHAEEIRFANGELTFSGRLLVPTQGGRHAAVVLIPGGPGPAGRNENYFSAADLLASAGIATLTFDKRGTGASTGNWREASYTDFARDAIAAVQYLRGRRDIDARCVGLLGFSEGGWIAPLAARLSPDVAFVAVIGASGLSHADADLALLDVALRADSVVDSERLRALELERAVIEYASTRRGWSETRARLDTIRAAPWLSRSVIATHTGYDFPATEEHWFWRLYGLDARYDPVATLREVRVPLLAVWGQWDAAAPPQLNVPAFENGRAGRGSDRYRLAVVPRGDHVVWEFPTANTSGFHLVRRFVPEYFDLLRGWLTEQAHRCGGTSSGAPATY